MKISHILESSRVDGPDERTVLFTQGCAIHCKGCQNVALWDPKGGREIAPFFLSLELMEKCKTGNITISGGEPFAQAKELADLVFYLKTLPGIKHVMVYSGYTWEQLTRNMSKDVQFILENIDILVDGPFQAAKDDTLITYRGSRNQRAIDPLVSLQTGRVVSFDWDNPEIILTDDGIALMPEGLAEIIELGEPEVTRRCGQTTPVGAD